MQSWRKGSNDIQVNACAEFEIDLTNIRQDFDTALNRALLDWGQPVTMVDPEHCLQQLDEDGLPRLRRRYKGAGKEAVD